jgi:hypothetical protein
MSNGQIIKDLEKVLGLLPSVFSAFLSIFDIYTLILTHQRIG